MDRPDLNYPYMYLMDRECQSDFYEDQSTTDQHERVGQRKEFHSL